MNDERPNGSLSSPHVRREPITVSSAASSRSQSPAPPSPQSSGRSVRKGLLGTLVFILVTAVLFGGYHASRFVIDFVSSRAPEWTWVSTSSVIAWILAALVVLSVFGVLRFITSFIARLFSFVFKFAQSDVVTIVVASGVNILFLALDWWLTSQTVSLIEGTGVKSFFTSGSFFSLAVLFLMFAAALVWIPRTGMYGENALGAALDENPRW